MATRRTKTKNKPITLDDFAALIQKDLARMVTKDDLKNLTTKKELATIRSEMATKNDLERFATNEELQTAFDTLADRIAIAKEDLREEIAGLRYAKEIDELRSRVNVIERKVGIKPASHAA